jgi:hypothetical protein
MWHVWERRKAYTGFWWKSPKERDHLKDRGVDGRLGLVWILGTLVSGGGVVWSGFAWHRIVTGGGLS